MSRFELLADAKGRRFARAQDRWYARNPPKGVFAMIRADGAADRALIAQARDHELARLTTEAPRRSNTGMDTIIVKTEGGDNCECNDGIPPGLFAVSRAEWEKIKTKVANSDNAEIERDCSNGGHGCLLCTDLKQVMELAEIVEENPSHEIVVFVNKAGDDNMLDELREWMDETSETVWLVTEDGGEIPEGIRVFTSQADARRTASKHKANIRGIRVEAPLPEAERAKHRETPDPDSDTD